MTTERRDTERRRGPKRPPVATLILLAATVLAVGLAAACGSSESATAPASISEPQEPAIETTATTAELEPAPEPEPVEPEPAEPEPEPAEEATAVSGGESLYLEAGCAACHGMMGEGTEVGPAVVGHSASQIHNQVRNPIVAMPAYTTAQLSDEELEQIVEFIVGLAPVEEHVEPVKLSEILAIHHWMALGALEAENLDDALHHVDHVIEAVRGEHRDVMRRARALIEEGDLHGAEHLVQEMLAGRAEPDLDVRELHLRLALTAIDTREIEDAVHHLRDYVDVTRGERRRKGEALLDLMEEGNLHDATHMIEELMGMTPHG